MKTVLRSTAIKNFLMSEVSGTPRDLAMLYWKGMECQVNVAQDDGERVSGEFMGRQWHQWTNGIEQWGSFRIPRNAMNEPEDNDKDIKWDLLKHVEGIGMTGWNWISRQSMWVAFDFDDIAGHSDRHGQKLSIDQLREVQLAAEKIPWVTVRRSTSGKGIHLYVFLEPVATKNHNEHAALARSILGKMSALTGFDFSANVDVCGHNMWVWHRKMKGTNGLTLIKQGSKLEEPPLNWMDHLDVIKKKRRKVIPMFIAEQTDQLSDADRLFLELTGQNARVPLDESHKKLINWLEANKCAGWWDSDHHMLVTHTFHLKEAHDSLSMRGIFETLSKGTEHGADHNCFCFPLRRGAWTVRRYTPGVQEAQSWSQDGAGWTRCFYNHEPDLPTAARSMGGVESPSGGFVFREAGVAANVAQKLGVNVNVPVWMASSRRARLKPHKDGRVIFEIDHDPEDSPKNGEMDGWLNENGKWRRIFNAPQTGQPETEVGNYDDFVRHLVTEGGTDYGWVIKRDASWGEEPLSNVKVALKSAGANPKEIDLILGSSVMKPWKVVNKPFQPMFPGDREWNRDAAQFRFVPSQSKDRKSYPSWMKILKHIGGSLDDAIKQNGWAQANAILTGADYLKVWLASLLQFPYEPLPYLFLWGPQDSGKSILHEGFSLLLTKGYVRADAALINQSGFNAELRYAILCVIEETDLRANKVAYARIKDWVTGRQLPVHEKGKTPVGLPNTTHWIQCNNAKDACPVFPGDTRITMIHVPGLDPLEMIPKRALLQELEKEGPDFIAELLALELPPPASRMNVEVIRTQDKHEAERANRTALEEFIDENCHHVDGEWIKLSEFFVKFQESLDPNELGMWTKHKVVSNMPTHFPKGRNPQDGQFYFGNISFKAFQPGDQKKPKLVIDGDKLRPGGK